MPRINQQKPRTAFLFLFLFAVMIISAFVIIENLRLMAENQRIAGAEYGERASLLAKQIIESKLVEKLIVVYGRDSQCSPGELMGHIGFVNTFSIFTGIYLTPPKNESEAAQVVQESSKCVPIITKEIKEKSYPLYSVSYLVLFPTDCLLPNKSIAVVIEADVENLTAKLTKGRLEDDVRYGLGQHVSTIDQFGNCSQEVIYKIATDLGIAQLPEDI